MINRRNVMGLTAAMASFVTGALSGKSAQAALPPPPKAPKNVPGTLAPRGRSGRMERLAEVDLESRMDFFMSFRSFANRNLSSAAAKRSEEILASNGIDPKSEIPMHEALPLLQDDPVVGTSTRAWLSVQQLSWDNLKREFEGNADAYLSEMEAVDNVGPGTLELNPDLELPDYTKHEIHIQPGGYVGNDFAGHMYHYGTNGFYTGRNTQDELHITAAYGLPTPADGKVKRILDVGCGIGQLTCGLKERFPDAEIWGIDAGGPMIRYGHLRAVERGLDVNFAQRLGEDTKFPDNYFDLVTSYIMFHEVSPEGTHAQVKEAFRITRPGGIYYPIDFNLRANRQRSAYRHYRSWWDHRWNGEVWTLKFRENGLPDIIRNAGFDLNEEGPEALPRFGILNATKPA